MTKDKIMQAAYSNFSEHGYSGGSLAQIAQEVGIRKQSIYTYFNSKDALYLTLSKEAMESELAFAAAFLEQREQLPVEEALFPFLQCVQQRFEAYAQTRFFISSIFLMPSHLEKQLSTQTYVYLDALERLFSNFFARCSLAVTAEEAAVSYLALLDSLYVEMLYGGSDRFMKRLHACWKIFYNGIKK